MKLYDKTSFFLYKFIQLGEPPRTQAHRGFKQPFGYLINWSLAELKNRWTIFKFQFYWINIHVLHHFENTARLQVLTDSSLASWTTIVCSLCNPHKISIHTFARDAKSGRSGRYICAIFSVLVLTTPVLSAPVESAPVISAPMPSTPVLQHQLYHDQYNLLQHNVIWGNTKDDFSCYWQVLWFIGH